MLGSGAWRLSDVADPAATSSPSSGRSRCAIPPPATH
ncbi:MAG: hypothetical protein WBQ44_22725 [Rhodococcus sp. (in: high G+C Gram-positive bacteria)]